MRSEVGCEVESEKEERKEKRERKRKKSLASENAILGREGWIASKYDRT